MTAKATPATRSAAAASGGAGPAAQRASAPSRAEASELVLVVEGDLDTGGATRLRALLDDAFAARRTVALDTSAVTHLSSAALAVLVAAHRRLRDGGGALVVRSPSPAVVRELRISGLHRVIALDPPEPV